MNHYKECPFFSSQAWAAPHKALGHRLLIWQGSAAAAAGEYFYAGEFGL